MDNYNKDYIREEEIPLWRTSGMDSREIIEKLRCMYNSSMNVIWGLLAREIGSVHIADIKDLNSITMNLVKQSVDQGKLKVVDGEIELKTTVKEKPNPFDWKEEPTKENFEFLQEGPDKDFDTKLDAIIDPKIDQMNLVEEERDLKESLIKKHGTSNRK